MSLDGFSMANLSLNNEIAGAQLAANAEQMALKEAEIKIKSVNESEKDGAIKKKDKDDKNGTPFNDGFRKRKSEENDDESEQNTNSNVSLENFSPNEFSLRINSETEMIELYSNVDKRIVETINANELMVLMSKLKNASGVLVNRKI